MTSKLLVLMESLFPSLESLGETSAQTGATDGSTLISFTITPTSSSSCSHAACDMEAFSQLSKSSFSHASISASVTAAVVSAKPFMQLTGAQQVSDVPAQAAGPAPTPAPSQHFMALPPTFLQTDSVTQTTPLPPPNPAPPAAAPALTTTTIPGTAAASVVAATTTDALTAVAQPVPLANNPVPISVPSLAPTPATITIAPTQNLLQPSLVMSDQNLQWILSTAASSQQNPESVSNAPTLFTCGDLICPSLHYFVMRCPVKKHTLNSTTLMFPQLFLICLNFCLFTVTKRSSKSGKGFLHYSHTSRRECW